MSTSSAPTEAEPANLLNGPMTVDSLRSAGYTSTEKALSELIDNSFEAGAENVVCVVVQRKQKANGRARYATHQIEAIYVVDDGESMDASGLNTALSFGGGNRQQRKGMGRFGMGLPQSSVSQCRRADLWGWQSSPGQARHTSLDLDHVAATNDLSVPWPEPAASGDSRVLAGVALPDVLRQPGVADEVFAGDRGQIHGTVVGWSQFDLLTWTKPTTVARKVAEFFGRTYRRFLSPELTPGIVANASDDEPDLDDVEHGITADILDELGLDIDDADPRPRRNLYIRIVDHGDDDTYQLVEHITGLDEGGQVRPNDPMYLVDADKSYLSYWEQWVAEEDGTVTEEHHRDAPFHNPFDDLVFFILASEFDQRYYPVRLRCSLARPEARPGEKAGNQTHQGREAKKNQGISVMRAGRELTLTDRLFDEPRDRWFGVEVEFPPALDAEFGVSNSKQAASKLSEAISLAHANQGAPRSDLENDGTLEPGTKLWAVYPVARRIYMRRTELRKTIESQKSGARTRHPADDSHETRHATQVDAEAGDEDLTVTEKQAKDTGKAGSPEGVKTGLTDLIDTSPGSKSIYTQEQIDAIAENLSSGATGYSFLIENDPDVDHFFRVSEMPGVAATRGAAKIIHLNVGHPVWQGYLDALRIGDEELAKAGEVELREIVNRARSTMVDLLIAWTRIELSSQETDAFRHLVSDVRQRWGRSARRYLSPDITSTDAFELLGGLLGGDEG